MQLALSLFFFFFSPTQFLGAPLEGVRALEGWRAVPELPGATIRRYTDASDLARDVMQFAPTFTQRVAMVVVPPQTTDKDMNKKRKTKEVFKKTEKKGVG